MMIAQKKERRLSKMAEKSDDFIKRLFPSNLVRLGAIILCFGIAIGFGGNKIFSYLVTSSTDLDFQKVNARLEAVNTRLDVDEKMIDQNDAQLKELATLSGKIDVIAQKVSDIKDTVDKLQFNNPSWPKNQHDSSKPW